MTSFYLPNAAKPWFKHILGNKETGFFLDFDIYYYCLLTGLLKLKKNPDVDKKDMTEIIRYFPDEYVANKHFIIALFLKTELSIQGIQLSEKKALDKELSRLLNPSNGGTSLSEDGMTQLNYYAFGGFRELQNHFPEPPRTLDGFLVGYYQFLNN
jgi:hypothetical protein